MTIIATTREGKKIVYAEGTEETIDTGTAPFTHEHTIRVDELKIVQALLQVSLKTDKVVQVSIPQNVDISGNVIKFSLQYKDTATVTPQVIAVGF